jgi:hypothetical protein
LQGQRANKGVMITTSDFSADARTFVNNNLPSRIVLINGQRLAEIAYFTPRRPPVSRHGGQAFHGKTATDFTHGGHPPSWALG